MKTYIYKYPSKAFHIIILLLIIFSLASTNGFCENYSRTITKVFEANQNTVLTIQHKYYGNLNIQNWEKDEISFNVVIHVGTLKPNVKGEEIVNKMSIQFSQDNDQIGAITEMADISPDIGVNFSFGVSYTVYIPKYISLNLSAKYCDVIINEINGLANIDVKYGKLSINKLGRGDLKPMNQLLLSYSSGIIEDAGWLKTDIKYSDLTIRKTQALASISKHSKLFVDEANSIASESAYDTYRIGKVANFVTSAEYTDFEFQEISKKLSVETSYGNITAKFIPTNFENINVVNNYGNINLYIDENASYRIQSNLSHCSLILPKTKEITYDSKQILNTSFSYQGHVGLNKQSQSIVSISSNYGEIKLSK